MNLPQKATEETKSGDGNLRSHCLLLWNHVFFRVPAANGESHESSTEGNGGNKERRQESSFVCFYVIDIFELSNGLIVMAGSLAEGDVRPGMWLNLSGIVWDAGTGGGPTASHPRGG